LRSRGPPGGFGHDGKPFFWIREGEPAGAVHVSSRRTAPDVVDPFHAAALDAGGEDIGPPGLRPPTPQLLRRLRLRLR
jgi:hypothetical protein